MGGRHKNSDEFVSQLVSLITMVTAPNRSNEGRHRSKLYEEGDFTTIYLTTMVLARVPSLRLCLLQPTDNHEAWMCSESAKRKKI